MHGILISHCTRLAWKQLPVDTPVEVSVTTTTVRSPPQSPVMASLITFNDTATERDHHCRHGHIETAALLSTSASVFNTVM